MPQHRPGPYSSDYPLDESGNPIRRAEPVGYSVWCPQCEEDFTAATLEDMYAIIEERHNPGMGEFARGLLSEP
jgi:hypothetical protein